MMFLSHIFVLISFLSFLTQLGHCLIQQALFGRKVKKYLANHVIESTQSDNDIKCAMSCVRHGTCASVNYKVSGVGKGLCELNDKALHEASGSDEETKPEFVHLYIIKKVSQSKSNSFFFITHEFNFFIKKCPFSKT